MSSPRSLPSSRRCEASSRCTPSDRPEPADHDEQIDEVGLGREQLAELVDDHEQRRQRLERRALLARPLVVLERGVVARRRAASPAADPSRRWIASFMRSTRISSSARFVITADVCGSTSRPANVAPPLKSTSTKLSDLGRVREGEAQHERAQQLRLARAGRADHQPVRAHAALRRLLDVELDRLPARLPTPIGTRSRSRGARGTPGHVRCRPDTGRRGAADPAGSGRP